MKDAILAIDNAILPRYKPINAELEHHTPPPPLFP